MTDPLLGQDIGGFTLESRLGEGGMGAVYVARQRSLGREVVVKVMKPEYASDPAYRERFVREARAISALSHPNVVSVYDFGLTSDAVLYLAMERLKGRTLHQVLCDDGPLDELRALQFAQSIARALAEVHAIGVVHRDLKPDNVFVTTSASGEEIVKVLDFGLAKSVSAGRTRSGVVGTPGYMSPEQMKGNEIGPASDLYALGLLWWEMLTGLPVHPDVDDAYERMLRVLSEGVPPPTSVRPRPLVDGHEELVCALLARDPKDRPVDVVQRMASISRRISRARTTDITSLADLAPPTAPMRPMIVATTRDDGPATRDMRPPQRAVEAPKRRSPVYVAIGAGLGLLVSLAVLSQLLGS